MDDMYYKQIRKDLDILRQMQDEYNKKISERYSSLINSINETKALYSKCPHSEYIDIECVYYDQGLCEDIIVCPGNSDAACNIHENGGFIYKTVSGAFETEREHYIKTINDLNTRNEKMRKALEQIRDECSELHIGYARVVVEYARAALKED